MRISDWSSDVCSVQLLPTEQQAPLRKNLIEPQYQWVAGKDDISSEIIDELLTTPNASYNSDAWTQIPPFRSCQRPRIQRDWKPSACWFGMSWRACRRATSPRSEARRVGKGDVSTCR